MKFCFALILMLCCILSVQAKLTFDSPRKEFNAGFQDKIIIQEFTFKNEGNQPVKITQAEGDCSCLGVDIADSKWLYAPGESGMLRARFEIGNFLGTVDKAIRIWTEGDAPDSPSSVIHLVVNIPVIISLEPKTLKWTKDALASPQKIRVSTNYSKPIRILATKPSNPGFTVTTQTIESGKIYEIEVIPKDISKVGICIIRIETDLDIPNHKVQQAFAVISNAK